MQERKYKYLIDRSFIWFKFLGERTTNHPGLGAVDAYQHHV